MTYASFYSMDISTDAHPKIFDELNSMLDRFSIIVYGFTITYILFYYISLESIHLLGKVHMVCRINSMPI